MISSPNQIPYVGAPASNDMRTTQRRGGAPASYTTGAENQRTSSARVVSASARVHVTFLSTKANGAGPKTLTNFGITGKGKVDCVVHFGTAAAAEITTGLRP